MAQSSALFTGMLHLLGAGANYVLQCIDIIHLTCVIACATSYIVRRLHVLFDYLIEHMSVNIIQHNKYLQHVITAVIFYTLFGARLARFLLVTYVYTWYKIYTPLCDG